MIRPSIGEVMCFDQQYVVGVLERVELEVQLVAEQPQRRLGHTGFYGGERYSFRGGPSGDPRRPEKPTLFGPRHEREAMTDDETPEPEEEPPAEASDATDEDETEKSFRERVEEIRERREQEREEGDRPDPEEMMGGGGPPGMGGGGGGGNPFAQMMSGMMGGGGPGGAGGPPGMGGGRPGEGGDDSAGNEELVREVRQLRDEVRDATRQLQRIAQALEDD